MVMRLDVRLTSGCASDNGELALENSGGGNSHVVLFFNDQVSEKISIIQQNDLKNEQSDSIFIAWIKSPSPPVQTSPPFPSISIVARDIW